LPRRGNHGLSGRFIPAKLTQDARLNPEEDFEVAAPTIPAPQTCGFNPPDPFIGGVWEYVWSVKSQDILQQHKVPATLDPLRRKAKRELLFPLRHVLQNRH
jgi:hypothetical protein